MNLACSKLSPFPTFCSIQNPDYFTGVPHIWDGSSPISSGLHMPAISGNTLTDTRRSVFPIAQVALNAV